MAMYPVSGVCGSPGSLLGGCRSVVLTMSSWMQCVTQDTLYCFVARGEILAMRLGERRLPVVRRRFDVRRAVAGQRRAVGWMNPA